MPAAQKSYREIAIVADMGDSKVLQDRLLDAPVFIWRGETVAIRVLCALNGAELDLSNIASLTCQVKPANNRDGSAVMSKTVLAASLDVDATLVAFDAGSAQHAVFEFTKAETNLTLDGNEDKYWMVIHGETTDSPSKEITYAAGVITVEEDGTAGGSAPEVSLVAAIDDTDSPYTIPAGKQTILVDSSAGAVTVNLPAAPVDGQLLKIKDAGGAAATNVITVSGNGKNIDGQASAEIADNWAAMTVQYSGSLGAWFAL